MKTTESYVKSDRYYHVRIYDLLPMLVTFNSCWSKGHLRECCASYFTLPMEKIFRLSSLSFNEIIELISICYITLILKRKLPKQIAVLFSCNKENQNNHCGTISLFFKWVFTCEEIQTVTEIRTDIISYWRTEFRCKWVRHPFSSINGPKLENIYNKWFRSESWVKYRTEFH